MAAKTGPTGGEAKNQIAEWLLESDKLIRAGRYLVADELLQKVLTADPGNENARSAQDRISFLIKQLSQRPDLNKDLREEIRKYSELLVRRKVTHSGSMIEAAQKALEEGDLKKASDHISKAISLDPENRYAKAVMQRLTELQKKHSGSADDAENVLKFRSFLWETWHRGNPTEAQLGILKNVQRGLGIGGDAAIQLERDVKNRMYRDALTDIWRSGGISAFTIPVIEELRAKFGVTKADHLTVEAALLRDVRKDRVRGTVLVVEGDEKSLLEITEKLRAHSFAVIAAAGVEEAIATLETGSPDIVLSEVHFQERPLGFDLYEVIRTAPATQHAAFFFMAPAFDRTTRIIGKRLGVDEFIFKPIDYEMLVGALIGKLLRKGGQKPPLAPPQTGIRGKTTGK